ncbi:hypothetical protein [Bacillus alkalicellulosilyticus]|nr:hypothetical protein [Bacillus alkalicellulosilyticus]
MSNKKKIAGYTVICNKLGILNKEQTNNVLNQLSKPARKKKKI